MSSAVLHDLGATAFGLLFIVIGAALYGPAPWSALRLLRTGRQVTATVVKARPGGMSRGGPGPGGYAVDRHYPPSRRLAEPGAETGYQAGQQLDIYVGGRLRTRIRTDAEANAHGGFEQLLGACLMLGGIGWLVA